MVAAPTSMIVASTTRAIVAPAMIAWLACRHGFCHRSAAALSALPRIAQERSAWIFRKAAGVHPPTNVPGAYGAPGLPGAPLFYVAANPCRRASHFGARRCKMAGKSHWDTAMKRFADLSEQEVLALAINNEEEDSRIYQGFADGL